jgi:hypothetical protein
MSRDLMLLHPTLIRRVQRLIHHPGAAGDLNGELRIGGVATHPSTSSSTRAEPERLTIRTV